MASSLFLFHCIPSTPPFVTSFRLVHMHECPSLLHTHTHTHTHKSDYLCGEGQREEGREVVGEMLHDAVAPVTRVFTIHLEGEVHRASIDCRTIRTLRELLTMAVPFPVSPPTPPNMTATAKRHTSTWVDSCICTSGGQRLSLAISTEWAPTVLQVSLATRHAVAGMEPPARVCGSKRRRMRYRDMIKMEDDDNDDDNSSSSSNSNSSSFSSAEGEGVSRHGHHPYWCRGNHKVKNEEKVQNDDLCCLSGSTLGGQHDEIDEDDNEDEDCDDTAYSNDARHCEAVLPVVVGGVVRLVNTESRDKSHEWTVYVRGLFNENHYLAQCIESVRFILDPSFTPSERLVTAAPFELTEVGWGEFVVKMKLQLRHYPRPIQVTLSSSRSRSMSAPCDAQLEVNMVSEALALNMGAPLAGITRGPVISPLIDVLSHHCYQSCVNNDKNGETMKSTSMSSSVKNQWMPSTVRVKTEKQESDDKNGTDNTPVSRTHAFPAVGVLGMSPGVVMLSHSLRFSHRPRRPHCIPPLGRPYEPEEHIGYTLVQVPVVTEQYDEIVIPDPPVVLREAAEGIPDLLRRRIATVKAARSNSVAQQHAHETNGDPQVRAAAAFNEKGVSCWKYIMQEEPDDAVLAEAYLDSVAVTRRGAELSHPMDNNHQQQQPQQQQQQHALYGGDPMPHVKPGRGRRKLTGAEIDLAALRTARKGLLEAIEKMRREVALRQAVHVSQQFT